MKDRCSSSELEIKTDQFYFLHNHRYNINICLLIEFWHFLNFLSEPRLARRLATPKRAMRKLCVNSSPAASWGWYITLKRSKISPKIFPTLPTLPRVWVISIYEKKHFSTLPTLPICKRSKISPKTPSTLSTLPTVMFTNLIFPLNIDLQTNLFWCNCSKVQ